MRRTAVELASAIGFSFWPWRLESQRLAQSQWFRIMVKNFKRGDHVQWNSEAGRVRGVITKKVVSDVRIKGYVHHATKDEPQYFIKSDKSDHVAIHKGAALKLLGVRKPK